MKLRWCSNLIKQNSENFSKNSNLDYAGITLPAFLFRTYLKLHNLFVSPKLVKKVITKLHSSKVPAQDFIPVAVLKNCEPELLYMLVELSNICLKESYFSNC